MSRIGKLPITLPQGIQVTVENNEVIVKGKLGELKQIVKPEIQVAVEDGSVKLSITEETKENKSLHGLYRALINNMVVGVSEGFKADLELVGVGYKATNTGQVLELTLGYSHYIYFQLPKEIKVETTNERGKNSTIALTSYDKQLLGQVVAKIRSLRPPEPYKGKGIRFKNEVLRRKVGKSAAKK
ncbi:MAG: 50S ribosomal protein L6 [Bacteroidales bacterium]|jgi:large subunit ribosomal protein L6|nr:50S ribosomal protein L6 [Bacteroidales bacterium]